MLYNFQLISFAKFRHMAILAVFCGYFGYFAIMNPKYFEPKLVPNCCPKGTWYFPVCHTPCTFIPKLLEVLAQLCVSNSTHRSEPTSFAVLQKEPKSKSRSIEHEKVSFFQKRYDDA